MDYILEPVEPGNDDVYGGFPLPLPCPNQACLHNDPVVQPR